MTIKTTVPASVSGAIFDRGQALLQVDVDREECKFELSVPSHFARDVTKALDEAEDGYVDATVTIEVGSREELAQEGAATSVIVRIEDLRRVLAFFPKDGHTSQCDPMKAGCTCRYAVAEPLLRALGELP